MGLDNGFVVKSNKGKIIREDLPKELIYPFGDDFGYAPEIVYWRKNWGLRTVVLNSLDISNSEGGCFQIDTSEQIFKIIKIIFSFMDEKVWEEEGYSIWTYEEIKPILERDIINLVLMIPFMRENPDVYLEFYDSY